MPIVGVPSAFSPLPAFTGLTLERPLTTLFGNTTFSDTTVVPANPISPRKHSLLPVLTVLFLISYGLMTMLIVEQGSTIESQRSLIHELLHDSTELSAVKGKAIRERNLADGQRQTETPSAQTPSNRTPLTQVPSTQAPLTQAPSSQVAPQHQGESHGGKTQKPQFQLPARPASDLADVRRALRTI